MLRYIGRRLLEMIPILLVVAVLIFLMMEFVPGDPVKIILGDTATPAQIEEVREKMGFNEPFFVRFFDFAFKNVFSVFESLGSLVESVLFLNHSLFETLDFVSSFADLFFRFGSVSVNFFFRFEERFFFLGFCGFKCFVYDVFGSFLGGSEGRAVFFLLGFCSGNSADDKSCNCDDDSRRKDNP